MSSEFQIGDLVWAKLKRFSPWPARIVKPSPNAPNFKKSVQKGLHWVYFFGTYDYAWIEEQNIKPYLECKDKLISTYNAVVFKKAVAEIEEFITKIKENPDYELELPIEKTETDENDDKFNKLVSSSLKKKPKKAPLKRRNSDSGGSTSRNSFSKRSRTSTPNVDDYSIGNVESELLDITASDDIPETSAFQRCDFPELLNTKDITTSTLTFGFLGLGVIGTGIVKNLIKSGHKVNLYNRTLKKCEEIKEQADRTEAGLVNIYITPCDVMQKSDIIFSCVTDPRSAKENVVGNCGVAGREGDILDGKGYVEMTGIDPQTSKELYEIIKSKGGRYLEAQVQGSKHEADIGKLLILAAGDKSLYIDCQSCFLATCKTTYFLGDVGYATKMNLIMQLMKGIALVGLAEGLALADRCGISSKDMLKIFSETNLDCPYLTNKAELIVGKDFKHVEQAIEHMQKDMKIVLDLSDQLKQPLKMTSTANEIYKHTRRLGYDGQDASCIYMRTRH